MDSAHGWDRLVPIGQLQLLDALHTTRRVTHAAALLGISQPTASQWLSRLRHHFGDELFVRAGGIMQPTPRAEELVQTAREALEALRTLAAGSGEFDPTASQRTFRLQSPDGTHVTLLPRLHRAMRREAPQVRLEMLPLTDNAADDLRTGQIDLALMLATPALQREFRSRPLGEQGWVCLRSQDNATALTLEQYRAAAHVNVTRSGWSEVLAVRLAAEPWQRYVVLDIPGVLGLPEVLSGSDLIATLPVEIGTSLARTAAPSLNMVVNPCPVSVPPITACAFWSHRHQSDPGHRWFRELVTTVMTTESSPTSSTPTGARSSASHCTAS
ncbi:LysR family transcriptional regulator [Rhodococcus opacus M213]|uniref:LysR family transcriptional regulator n=1 Tax=Rhodococcus opacus M213 TaxID=1129896 RepID=K8X7D2_RHOOP|nr:LysR family transcriptional regulator [Rhodococcus opacus]EKT77469.1 LysR family transcriptional regulator [Rhodococcus opacus M213]